MRHETPRICCPQCLGSGRVPLGWRHLAVVRLLQHRRELCAADIHRQLRERVIIPAINNRLERLRRLGFLARRRVGKLWLYRLTYGKQTRTRAH